MPALFTPEELNRLRLCEDRLQRNLLFVALLSRKVEAQTPSQRPIVVGGSAVEFYTTGGYMSADLDLVMLQPEKADAVLGESGFIKTGRYWTLAETDLLVEFPGRTLTYAPAAYDRTIEVVLSEGLSATIIGIEDILIGRLYSSVSERRDNDRQWALNMAALHYARIQWSVVDELARDNGITDAANALRAAALALAQP